MRILPLPSHPEALRPILDDLNNYLKHYDAIDLEIDLGLGEVDIPAHVRIGALEGHPEARRLVESVYQKHCDTHPWIKPRLEAFYKMLETPPPTPIVHPGFCKFSTLIGGERA